MPSRGADFASACLWIRERITAENDSVELIVNLAARDRCGRVTSRADVCWDLVVEKGRIAITGQSSL